MCNARGGVILAPLQLLLSFCLLPNKICREGNGAKASPGRRKAERRKKRCAKASRDGAAPRSLCLESDSCARVSQFTPLSLLFCRLVFKIPTFSTSQRCGAVSAAHPHRRFRLAGPGSRTSGPCVTVCSTVSRRLIFSLHCIIELYSCVQWSGARFS